MTCTDTKKTNNYGIYLVGHVCVVTGLFQFQRMTCIFINNQHSEPFLQYLLALFGLTHYDRMSRYLHMAINDILDALKVKTGQVLENSGKYMQGFGAAVLLSCNALKQSLKP